MSGERKLFKAPIIGQLTQGSIINGCIAELLPGEEVFGCVITPRCALSHDGKIETVHYLPLIPFKRWFDLIAKPIIEKEWKNDCRNALNAKFHAAKAGTSIMDAMFSYEEMIAEVKQNFGDLISPNRTTMICKCLEYRFNYLRKML